MLSRTNTEPVAGELQRQVDRLADTLAVPALAASRKRDEARLAVTAARKALTDAGQAFASAPDTGGRDVEGKPTLGPEKRAALAAVHNAEGALEVAKERFRLAVDNEDTAFLAAIGPKLTDAHQTLVALAQLLHEVADPLQHLHWHAASRQHSMPRMLTEVPNLLQAVRTFTAVVNLGAAPARAEDGI